MGRYGASARPKRVVMLIMYQDWAHLPQYRRFIHQELVAKWLQMEGKRWGVVSIKKLTKQMELNLVDIISNQWFFVNTNNCVVVCEGHRGMRKEALSTRADNYGGSLNTRREVIIRKSRLITRRKV